MKNLIAIAVVVWLLFMGGLTTLRQLTSGLSNAPQTVITGAERLAQTVQPGPQASRPVAPIVPVARPAAPAARIVVPQGMPNLPTVTPTPAPQAAQAAPAVDMQATADKEAAIRDWLQGPVSTDTPWPTATPVSTEDVPTFVASFQEPPKCSPFIGYIGAKKAECDAFFATQTAEAAQ